MPQISGLYSLIRVLTAPIVTQVNPIVNCPSGRVNNNPCPSLLVTMLHGFFFFFVITLSHFYLLPPIICIQLSYSKGKSLASLSID